MPLNQQHQPSLADSMAAAMHGEPGLKLPSGRIPDTAAELDGSDIVDTLLQIQTPRKPKYGRGHPKYPPHNSALDNLPDTCQGAGCLAAHYLAMFAEACSRDRGCRDIFGIEPQGQKELSPKVGT